MYEWLTVCVIDSLLLMFDSLLMFRDYRNVEAHLVRPEG